jgi:hypothetical protein
MQLPSNFDASNCIIEGCRRIPSYKKSHAECCVPVCRQVIIQGAAEIVK